MKQFLFLFSVLIFFFGCNSFAGPLIHRASNLCLDVRAASSTPGALVQIYACHGGVNQNWAYSASTSQLRTFNGTRCLDASGEQTSAGTQIISYTCHTLANQQWRLMTDGSIVGVQSGRCLGTAGASNASGSLVQLANCNGSLSQKWTLQGDTQPPTAPSGLQVSSLTCNSASLKWNASTDNVAVTAYDIYHDGQLMKSVTGTTLSTSLTLTPGATWGLYVNARDAAGNVSQAGPTLTIRIPQCTTDTQKPTVPTGLQGSVNGTTVSLRWNASTDNVGVTGYEIYRNNLRVGSVSTLTFTDSGLSANTTYSYAVAARDAQGNVSALSAPISLRTGSACSTTVCSVSQATTETDIPWGLVTLPDGNILYSRRDAFDIIRLNPTIGAKANLGRIPNVAGTDGEGGLLGLAITPQFPSTDPWLYIYHTSPTDNRIVRIQYVNGALSPSTLQVLLTGIGRNKFHNGGRLRFGPDGKLYAATGDAQNGANAQNINNLAGKILRLNPDGSRPTDNPFGNYVWSYGHRNPQGLAFDSQGRLWEQEFGNTIMDETNLIQRGGNYGWPSCEGTASIVGSGCATAGYLAPKYTTTVAAGSCSGIAIVQDHLFVACLRGTRMYHHEISGTSLINSQQFFVGTYGRLRTIEPSRDGGLWLTTSNSGDKDSIANNSNERILKVILGEL
ncbi:MAG: PQQ-dependent sugar dehydrogenase [Pseudobdellovibrionaceae bacterium]